ncbi:unnamed protein product [Prunus brigantina]
MIFLHSSQADVSRCRISTCISVSNLYHHSFCYFFMFGISRINSLGFLCSFYLSFCESFLPFLCESFICIVMAWFFQALSLFGSSEFALLVGVSTPTFLRSCVIIMEKAQIVLIFYVRSLYYCNDSLRLVFIGSLWLVTFLTEL